MYVEALVGKLRNHAAICKIGCIGSEIRWYVGYVITLRFVR